MPALLGSPDHSHPRAALTQELVMPSGTERPLFAGGSTLSPESMCGAVGGIFSSFPAWSPRPSPPRHCAVPYILSVSKHLFFPTRREAASLQLRA